MRHVNALVWLHDADHVLYPQYTCEICTKCVHHYNDVRMGAIESHITSLTIVYSTVYSGTYQRKHQSSASLAFVRRVQRWPVNSPHKGPVTRKRFPFDDVIMILWGIWGNWPQTRVSQAPKSSYYTYRLTLRQLLQQGPKTVPSHAKAMKIKQFHHKLSGKSSNVIGSKCDKAQNNIKLL